MKREIPGFLLSMEERSVPLLLKGTKYSLPFIDRTIRKVAGFISTFYLHGELSSGRGLFQVLDARIKFFFLIWYILLISILAPVSMLAGIAAFIFILYILSGIWNRQIYFKIFLFSFWFGFLIALPASLNLITPGKIIISLGHLQEEKQFWIYRIPAEIGITMEGVTVVARLSLKVLNSVALSLLVYYTTPFHMLIKAMRSLRIPDLFLMIITLAYKFIFILSHTVQETYYALKLRWWKKISHTDADRIIAGRIVYLFRMSWQKYEEAYMAMLARGFQGKMDLCYIDKLKMKDFLFLILSFTISMLFYFYSR